MDQSKYDSIHAAVAEAEAQGFPCVLIVAELLDRSASVRCHEAGSRHIHEVRGIAEAGLDAIMDEVMN